MGLGASCPRMSTSPSAATEAHSLCNSNDSASTSTELPVVAEPVPVVLVCSRPLLKAFGVPSAHDSSSSQRALAASSTLPRTASSNCLVLLSFKKTSSSCHALSPFENSAALPEAPLLLEVAARMRASLPSLGRLPEELPVLAEHEAPLSARPLSVCPARCLPKYLLEARAFKRSGMSERSSGTSLSRLLIERSSSALSRGSESRTC
mmetsp:Transcript_1202/g.2265  ORF Transcript_1202/g.2265 Transcript_1202/m.2265 type:complete len:207 (-) Transcript_1202:160-780(-)